MGTKLTECCTLHAVHHFGGEGSIHSGPASQLRRIHVAKAGSGATVCSASVVWRDGGKLIRFAGCSQGADILAEREWIVGEVQAWLDQVGGSSHRQQLAQLNYFAHSPALAACLFGRAPATRGSRRGAVFSAMHHVATCAAVYCRVPCLSNPVRSGQLLDSQHLQSDMIMNIPSTPRRPHIISPERMAPPWSLSHQYQQQQLISW
jgi:hypothetical protein